MSDSINSFDFIRIGIDRAEVESLSFDRLIQLIAIIEADNDNGKRRQGNLDLTFTGYDDDPREIWEIPEIMRWFKGADKTFRNWFYYMSIDPGSHGLYLYYVCTCRTFADISTNHSNAPRLISLDTKLVQRFFKKNFKQLNKKCCAYGISEEQIDLLSKKIGCYLEIPRTQSCEIV